MTGEAAEEALTVRPGVQSCPATGSEHEGPTRESQRLARGAVAAHAGWSRWASALRADRWPSGRPAETLTLVGLSLRRRRPQWPPIGIASDSPGAAVADMV